MNKRFGYLMMAPNENELSVNNSDPEGQTRTQLAANQSQPEYTQKKNLVVSKLSAGTIVGDNYVVIELLGSGGMGYVYKVRHRILEKVYAMKTISSEQFTEKSWRRLQVEAQAMARINHPNIVGIHNLGIHLETLPFYVMDYLKGENLAQILKQRKKLTLEESLPIFIEICNGLGFAHKKGIVHRDIKPGNIIVLAQRDATGATVKIVDFGIAKLAWTADPNNQKLTSIGEIFGSPLYMSPEQCEGKRIDTRCDIYSLGCTFFETLTGVVPLRGESPIETMMLHSQTEPPSLKEVSGVNFPESIELLIATMLAKAPMNRYQNLETIAEYLEKIRAGEEISTTPLNNSIDLKHYSKLDNEGEETKQETHTEKSTQQKLNKFAITGTVLLFVAAAFLGSGIMLKSPTTIPTETKVAQGTAAAVEKAAQIAKTINSPTAIAQPQDQFYSTTTNDGKHIVFQFPLDQSIGKISSSDSKTRKQAKGRTLLKLGRGVNFEANEYLCAHPNLIDLFRPTDLWSFSTPAVFEKSVDIKPVIPHLAKLTSLVELNLKASNANNSIIPFLEKLPNLQYLNVDTTEITGDALAKYKGLKNLKEVRFGYNKGVTELLSALAGSKQLEILSLVNPDKMLTLEQAKLIAKCKNLRVLDVQASGLTDDSLRLLAALPNIRKLDASGCATTEETVQQVKALYARKGLNIVMSSTIQDAEAFDNESPADWIR